MENNNQKEVYKLCPNCSAKCKSAYQFCNECGASLQNVSVNGADNPTDFTTSQSSTSFTPNTPIPPTVEDGSVNEPAHNNDAVNDNIPPKDNAQSENTEPSPEQNETPEKEPIMSHFFDGVSAEDMFNYTGKKPKLYANLQKQQMAPMNKLFCLPLFIIGILFGFFGIACWYIYHKLYKQAALFFGLSLFFYVIDIVGVYSVIDSITALIPQLLASSSEPTEQEAIMMMQSILKGFPFVLTAISNIGGIAKFVLAIVMPFYAYNTYRLTAIDRIKKARTLPYNVDISSVGGTSKGYLALAIGIGIIITIIAAALLIAPLFKVIFELITESPELFEDIPTHSFNPYSDFVY